MFKLNMNALRKTANSAVRIATDATDAANAANLSDESTFEPEKLAALEALAELAELAVSQQLNCTLQANPANDPRPEPPTEPNAWRELARAYHRHHFGRRSCIAAGHGAEYGLRCGVGPASWDDYQKLAR